MRIVLQKSMRIAQITTVHPRNDTRVALKECPDLTKIWGSEVCLLVADGKGDAEQANKDQQQTSIKFKH